MMLGRFGISALLVALTAATAPGSLDGRDCGDKCVVVEEKVGPHPEVYLQAVVWVDKAGVPVCTITETVTAHPSPHPPPPPPPPPVKIVPEKEEKLTTTTTCATTTTVHVKPAAPTKGPAPPKHHEPKPAPQAPSVVEETTECSGDCAKGPSTIVEEVSHCEGGCSKDKAAPTPKSKPKHEGGKKGGPVPPPNNIRTQHGVSYAAYRADHSCKTKEDINDDFNQMKGRYSLVRTYGVDCHQVEYIYEAAKRTGFKVFYGIWDLKAVEAEASKIIAGVGGDWDIVDSISVGNELVNNGEASAEEVVRAVKQARQIFRKAGYKGPVVAVDTFTATEAHPQLCEASDYCAINAHAFFDSTISADQAGPWLVKTVESIKSKLSTDKKVIITETGWPTEGSANGLAIPGMKNQKMALESISKSFSANPGDIILFSAFNDLWKGPRDKYWGIGGAVSRCDR